MRAEKVREQRARENAMRMWAPRGHPRAGALHGSDVSFWCFGGLLCASHDLHSQPWSCPSLLWVRVSSAAQHEGRLSLHVQHLPGRPARHNGLRGEP